MKSNLAGVLEPPALLAIEIGLRENVRQLYKLGRDHYLFAKRQNNRAWRQKVSRYYYGCYNVSRALRLFDKGDFSTDSTDHKKIIDLPAALPSRARFESQLSTLRDDRNTCDYDHTARLIDLALGVSATESLASDFLDEAAVFLESGGLEL